MENKRERILKDLRRYYDEVAWKRQEGSTWTDTNLEVSPTRLNDWYTDKEHARNRRRLKEEGMYFLDAGCGARPYRVYAAGYRHHVCVDFSMAGLKGARKALGRTGYYVLADMRQLPFKSDVFNGFTSLYAIHHIPGQENQQMAFKELHRSLKPTCSGVVIYDNPYHLGIRLRKWLPPMSRLKSFISSLSKGRSGIGDESERMDEAVKARKTLLHYEPLPGAFIMQIIRGNNTVSIGTHSLLTESFKKIWLRDNAAWQIVLRALLLCESIAGRALWPLAPVWYILIRKRERSPR